MMEALKSSGLVIWWIAGQARKIENPDYFPEGHLWGTI